MKFTTSWLAILLLAVASAEDLSALSRKEPEEAKKNDHQVTAEVSNVRTSIVKPNRLRNEKPSPNDDNDLAPESDATMDDLLFFERLVNNDKALEEGNQRNSVSNSDNSNENSDNIDSNFENPIESKISTDLIDIRRQGDGSPDLKSGNTGPDIQFDDSKEVSDSSPRFGQRKSKQEEQDYEPVLQLTQGGYDRPFRRPRFRNRYVLRHENSDQSSQVEEPGKNSNANVQPETRRIIPQVTYSSPPQQSFGSRPILNPGIEAPRNMIAIHHVVPTSIQSAYFNNPPADFSTIPFQTHFPQSNEVGVFPNFGRDPNNAAFYQIPGRSPFQMVPEVLYQNAPDIQTQPILVEPAPARSVPPQFQSNTFAPYSGFQNSEDVSRPNYATYFRNPAVNGQFQVPSNFYPTVPDGVRAFNSPPLGYLANYPNSDKLPSRLFRYPVRTNAPTNQQNSDEQQNSSEQKPDSEASQEDKNAKLEERESDKQRNDDNLSVASFGNRLQAQNEADVYMRYPTIEAGYAIEENLPSQNNSDEVKDNSEEINSEQRNFPSADPFRNALNSVHINQRINNSFGFPPELFRDVPIDFGYQSPRSRVFTQHRGTNRGILHYPRPNFEPRGTFNPLATLPENNYNFPNVDNQQSGHQESDWTPSCAKQNNASICFVDNEYPNNDIVYSLNSNTFLADRLSGQELPLDSVDLVQRNVTDSDQTSEDYACSVDTQYGSPLRAKNMAGAWRVIVNVQGKFAQPVRMEVCKSLGDPCSYVDSQTKTSCVQKYSLQRLLSWTPSRGIYSDVYKIPVACSCQILKSVEP